MPYEEQKPCLYVKGLFEDHRRRIYNTNIIDKITEKLVSKIQIQEVVLCQLHDTFVLS